MPPKKHLILTYGVSEGRQRTIVLALPKVNALLAALSLMAVWSVGSSFYLLTAGFRTEAVVQAAAPRARPVERAAVNMQPIEVRPTPVAAPAPVAVEPAPAPATTPVAAVEKAPDPQLDAVVENYRATETIGKLVTHFGIRNLTNGIIRGKVVGEAEFVALDGSIRTVTAQQDYKARTLSAKQLNFVAPGPGKFTKVRLTVSDQATQRAVVFFK